MTHAEVSAATVSGLLSGDCYDPYSDGLGYIFRGTKVSEIRWLPYPDGPSNTTTIPIEDDPPWEAFSQASQDYNLLLQNVSNRARDPRLSFMRNRRVVVSGDSHDRRNVEAFCLQHPGSERKMPDFHLWSSCHIPDLNFTLFSWFNYGLPEEAEDW